MNGQTEPEGPRSLFTLVLIVVKTPRASLQMGLEQLADVNRAMEQHHNTLWDVHLRQTLSDAKHLSQSCQRKFIDFSFCFLDLASTLGFAKEVQLANGSLRGGFSQFILKQKERKIKFTCSLCSTGASYRLLKRQF